MHGRRLLATLTATVLVALCVFVAAQSSGAAVLTGVITNVTTTPANPTLTGTITTTVDWKVPNGTQAGDTFTLTLPPQLINLPGSFTLADPADNSVVANATISGGVVTFTMTSYAETHSNVSGSAFFTSNLDQSQVTYGQTVNLHYTINGNQVITTPVTVTNPGAADTTVPHKNGAFQGPDQAHLIRWTIITQTGPFPSAVLNDTIAANQQLDCNSASTPLQVLIGTPIPPLNNFKAGIPGNPTGDYSSHATVNCDTATNKLSVSVTGPVPAGQMIEVAFYSTIVSQDPTKANSFSNQASVVTPTTTLTTQVATVTQSSAGGVATGGPVPSVEIVKGDVNGNAADTAATEASLPTGGVGLVYTITNNGNEALKNLVVTDNVVANGTVTGLACDFSAFSGPTGVTTWPGPLPAGASFPCTATLSGVATGSDHEDIGTVTGVGVQSGENTSATNPYFAVKPPSVTVGNFVWVDSNRNGIQDAGEPGIPGVSMTVTGPTGQPVTNVDGSPEGPQVTDSTGHYLFTGLPALPAGQHYTVTIDSSSPALAPYVPTLANVGTDRTVDSSTGTSVSTDLTTDGAQDLSLDFGFVPPPLAIGDYVWRDTNLNGIQDSGEPAVPGVVVTLTDSAGKPVDDIDGKPVAATTTDANGLYHFDNLAAGSYVVTFTAPAGLTFTKQFAGSDTTVDSNADVATGASDVIALGPSDTNLTPSVASDSVTAPSIDRTIDAGLVPAGSPSISIVKKDAQGNDADTPATAVSVPAGQTTDLVYTVTNSGSEPLVNIDVSDMVTEGTATVSSLTCDFSALGGVSTTPTTWSGPFAVGASFVCHATLSALTPGVPHADLGAVAAAGQFSGTPVSANNPYNAETPPSYAIGDYVWRDTNLDGVQDSGEPPVVGATVTLSDGSGQPVTDIDGATVAPTTTDANGFYHFDNLPAGSYVVTFTAPAGFTFTQQFAGSDTTIDSNAAVSTGASDVIDLGPSDVNLTPSVASDSVTASQIDRTIDAGVIPSGSPQIKIVKTDDHGNDADTPATAVSVPAGQTTNLVYTVTNTGSEPLVNIDVSDMVTEGSATVSNLACDFSALGGVSSSPTSWSGPFAVGATFVCHATLSALTPGVPHADLGAVAAQGQFSGTPVTDHNPYNAITPPPVAIGDYVWRDTNANGIQDAGEPAVPGVVVTLSDAAGHPVTDINGALVAPTTTDANGLYHFDDLVAGSYVVTFTAPTGFTFTQQFAGSDPTADSNATVATGATPAVDVGPSDTNLTPSVASDTVSAPMIDRTIDAGLVPSGTPGITITKSDDHGNAADTPATGVSVPAGQTTNLVYTITNTGTEPLVDIDVSDMVTEGTATVTGLSCDFSALGGVSATPTSWSGPFAVGASFVCHATLSALSPGVPHADLGAVAAVGQFSGTPVTDHNPYHASTPILVSVGDRVWYDTNRNGLQDAGEPNAAGVTVELIDANGATVATTTTDANGFYSFTGLPPDTNYQEQFVAPANTSFTLQMAGSDDTIDSNPGPSGLTPVFTTPSNGTDSATAPDNPTIDAGLVGIDLSLTKTLITAGPFLGGGRVQFTLVPHNNGPSDALGGFSVTDVLPAGLTASKLSGAGYQCDLASLTCTDTTGANLATGADGGPITVTATITPGVGGVLHNVAYVAPAPGDVPESNPLVIPTTTTDTDTSPTNNDAQASLTVSPSPVIDVTTTTTVPGTTTTTAPTTLPAPTTTTTIPTVVHSASTSQPRPQPRTPVTPPPTTVPLARTGANVGQLVELGLLFVAAGSCLVVAERRRRRALRH